MWYLGTHGVLAIHLITTLILKTSAPVLISGNPRPAQVSNHVVCAQQL